VPNNPAIREITGTFFGIREYELIRTRDVLLRGLSAAETFHGLALPGSEASSAQRGNDCCALPIWHTRSYDRDTLSAGLEFMRRRLGIASVSGFACSRRRMKRAESESQFRDNREASS
jgi:hypothetical protein